MTSRFVVSAGYLVVPFMCSADRPQQQLNVPCVVSIFVRGQFPAVCFVTRIQAEIFRRRCEGGAKDRFEGPSELVEGSQVLDVPYVPHV